MYVASQTILNLTLAISQKFVLGRKMKQNSSVDVVPGETAQATSEYDRRPSLVTTLSSILPKDSSNAQPTSHGQFNPSKIIGVTLRSHTSQSPAIQAPPANSLIADVANSQAVAASEKVQTNDNSSEAQHIPIIFRFLVQQLASPLPVIFTGVVGLVLVAMLVALVSGGGVRVKLDLEVAPTASLVEKR